LLKQIIYRIRNNQLLVKGIVDTNYYLLAQLSSKIIGVLVIPIVARLLTVEEFAYYDLFLLTTTFISLVATLGIDSGMAIKIVESKDDKPLQSSLLVTTLAMSTAVLLVLWVAGILASSMGWIASSYSLLFINGLFLYTLIYQYNYNIFSFVRWVGKAKEAAWINFATYFLGIALGFTLLYLERKVEHYIVGIVAGNFIGALLSTWIVRHYLFGQRPVLQTSQFRDLMKLSLPYLPSYLSTYAMQFIDRLLVTNAFGMEGLGLYAIVNRISQIPAFGIQLISSGFQPVVYSNYENEKGKHLSQLIFKVFWASIVPAVGLTLVFGDQVLLIFGGEKYAAATHILPFIIASTLMLGGFSLFGFGYAIKRKTLYVTFITLGVVALIYLISLYLIKVRGISGVAEATFIASTAGAAFYIWLSERLYSFGYALKWMFISIAATTALLLFAYLAGGHS
jgi:O-antigen/teichoic acid export membrane protein